MSNDRLLDKIEKLEAKFERKLDKLDYRSDNIEKELAIYNEQLKFHIEGVKQNTRQNNLLREYIDVEVDKVRDDIRPISEHVSNIKSYTTAISTFFNIFSKTVGVISVLTGIIYSILRFIGVL